MMTDEEYKAADVFQGDEAEIRCSTVTIKTARKNHKCMTLTGRQDHDIEKGQRYRHEKALIDQSFWGEYRICLKCLDEWYAEGEDEE